MVPRATKSKFTRDFTTSRMRIIATDVVKQGQKGAVFLFLEVNSIRINARGIPNGIVQIAIYKRANVLIPDAFKGFGFFYRSRIFFL